MNHKESYLSELISRNKQSLATAVQKTIDDIVPQYISNFSFREHVVSLLNNKLCTKSLATTSNVLIIMYFTLKGLCVFKS